MMRGIFKFCILALSAWLILSVCQATLLNEDGTILSRKYLKSFEDVRSGSTFELPKYLVEVGEPRTCPEGKIVAIQ